MPGRPKDIDEWRRREYLDLERRRPHIPPGSITIDMLDPSASFECGYYGGNEAGITSQGKVTIIESSAGTYYGECKYCAGEGYYDGGLYGDCYYS